MGVCCTKAAQFAYLYEKYVNEDAWLCWDKHEARKYYRIGRVLGRGAFSEVCSWTQFLDILMEQSTCNVLLPPTQNLTMDAETSSFPAPMVLRIEGL
jgi:hypothetical protein